MKPIAEEAIVAEPLYAEEEGTNENDDDDDGGVVTANDAVQAQFPRIRWQTTKGPLEIELHPHMAPNGVRRIMTMCRMGFFDDRRAAGEARYEGVAFFRVNRHITQFGATKHRPCVSCGEENLLRYPGDPYFEESILLHEFAHAIHHMALVDLDETFDERLKQAYQAAMKAGLWKGKYAASNRAEYWAEGAQSWFDDNREDDHDHNHVNTREELREYDPGLAALCEEVFGDRAWRYQKPQDRDPKDRAHLKGYDVERAPRFRWPEGLEEWYRDYLRKKRPRD